MNSPTPQHESPSLLFRVAATFTAEPIVESLQFWSGQLQWENAEFSVAGYNQLFQELLNESSPAAGHRPGVNFFLVRLEDAIRRDHGESGLSAGGRLDQIRRVTLELISALQSFASKAKRPSVILLCPPGEECEASNALRQSLHLAYEECQRALGGVAGLRIITAQEVAQWYPVAEIHDPESDLQGHVPYTPEFFAALGSSLMRAARMILQPAIKAVIVDADQTLWSGVVGEVGEYGIVPGPERLSFQGRLLELKKNGVLLALASKNESSDVEEAFNRPDMVLRKSDFAGWKVSWQAKSESIRQLAQEWSLSPDAFVFIDDNPTECAEVQAAIPEILTINIPTDESELMPLLNHYWALDVAGTTSVDAGRAEMMQQQMMRHAEQKKAPTFAEFLASLDLKLELRSAKLSDVPRVSQLTQRTNQFNATGVQRTEAEIGNLLGREDYHLLILHAADRFGDYGDVGVAIFRIKSSLAFVENFLLSCRVLGKGVEHQFLARIGNYIAQLNCVGLVIPLRPTPRNEPVAKFLQKVCADGFKDGRYHFPVQRALQVKFNPATEQQSPETEASQPARGLAPMRPNFGRMAAQFNTASAVVQTLAVARRRVRPTLESPLREPSTATQRVLVEIWGEVLQVDPIGIDDRFTDLGGQSLWATRVVSLIAKRFRVHLPLTCLFTHPTIQALAQLVEASPLRSSPSELMEDGDAIAPAEQRLWFLDQFIAHRAAYHIPTGRKLHGLVRTDALETALRLICERHPILRTTFRSAQGKALRQVSSEPGVAWRQQVAHSEQEAHELALSEAGQPFSLEEGPLFRALLIRIHPEEHWLVVTFHHAISDGWSVNRFYQDLTLAYHAALRQRTPLWPSLQATGAGYASWLNRRLTSGEMNGHLDYWKQALSGAPTVLQLPTDRQHPAVKSYAGALVSARLPATIRDGIQSLAKEARVTPFVVLISAFQALLHRLSGQEEILVGTPASGRTLAALENVLGCFVNTLVLRSKQDEKRSFLEFAQTTGAQVVGALSHQELPFEHLVDALQLPRDLSHTPLIQHVFVMQDVVVNDFNSPGLTSQAITIHNGGAKFDLVLEVTPREDSYEVTLEYDTAILDATTAQRWLQHYVMLLESACALPSRPIHELPLLSAEERTELIHGFNAHAPTGEETGSCLHQWFEATAALWPDHIALVREGTTLTYSETNLRANRLAYRLMEAGVVPDTLVGIYAERGLELVIAVLGVLKAGGAYLPMDPSSPAERLKYMLEDAQAPVLLTHRSLQNKAPTHGGVTLLIDSIGEDVEIDGQNPHTFVTPDHAAYVIYTSGSTGQPKGCVVTHRNVTRLMKSTEAWFEFNDRDVWSLFHSAAFDFSVWEMWGALLYGGRLVIVPYVASRSPEEFYKLLAQERVTVLNQTPSAFRQLIASEQAAATKLALSLRFVIFGGEALEMRSLKSWFDVHGDQTPKLVNMYGITETTVHVTYRPLTASDVASGSVIGIPIPDLQVYILDPYLQPVPVGVPGEMYVGGAGLARGYLRRPELTEQRFIPDHLSGRPKGRLYKTGDLARFLPGRDIEYLGRIDHQVKVRGFRIELGEIESALLHHAAVKEVAVVAHEGTPGEKRLVAYIVPHGEAPQVELLRQHLLVTLPEYMVPSIFVMMTAFPLTGNGKLDRAALPLPQMSRDSLSKAYVAPKTKREIQLADIWSSVLKVSSVGTNDNFFELGGDSILSIHMIAQARKVGLSFTPRQLFENQTIAKLAALEPVASSPAQPSVKASRKDIPLLPMQQWFFEQSLDDSHYWNQAFLFTVSERLDEGGLRHAVAELIKRHEALRLRFHHAGFGWQQSVADYETASIVECHHLQGLDNGRLGSRIEEIAVATQRSLNYRRGPLMRLAYMDLGEDRPGRLLIAVHHLAIDGVSWGILLADLESAYRGNDLPEIPTHYADAVAVAGAWTRSPAGLKEKAWWADRVPASIQPLLPKDGVGGANLEQSVRTLSFTLNADETQLLLQQVPKVFRTRINDVLLGALLMAVRRTLGRNDFWLHLEGHGREDLYGEADLSRTIGWFTGLFPIRLQSQENSDVCALVRGVRDELRKLPNQGAGYGFLRYADHEPLSASDADIVFNYLGRLDQLTDASDFLAPATESTGRWHSPESQRKHAHEIDCSVLRGQFQFDWKFSINLHQDSTVQPLVEAVAGALREIISAARDGMEVAPEPADFPWIKLPQQEIDRLMKLSPRAVDLLPLSPMQDLFYSSLALQNQSGFDQWQCRLQGPLDVDRFRGAWDQVLRRHSILCSSFHGTDLEHPVQAVHEDLSHPWHLEDWRGQSLDDQDQNWQALLKKEAAMNRDLAAAPLTSFALVRVQENEWRLLWVVPALMMDGWSWPIVFGEVGALMGGASLPAAHSYKEFLVWLQNHGTEEQMRFWRGELRGWSTPTPLPLDYPVTAKSSRRFMETSVTLDSAAVSRLTLYCRQQQVTMAALMHAAWAAMLAHGSKTAEVVFGTASNGRPDDLPGVESIVGPFTNNLPVRVKVQADMHPRELIIEAQAKLFSIASQQYASLAAMQECSEVPWRHRLFDSLLVYQNYLVGENAASISPGVTMSEFSGPLHTGYPLLLVITPGEKFHFLLKYQDGLCSAMQAQLILQEWERILTQLTAMDQPAIGEILAGSVLPALQPALPAPTVQRSDRLLPRTTLEKQIASIWHKAFGMEDIGVDENFFDLGGHSLLMLRVHQRLRAELDVHLSVVQVFQYPTIASLAQALDPASSPTNANSSRAAQARERAAAARAAMARGRQQS